MSHLSLTKIAELIGAKHETVAKRLRARGLEPAAKDGRGRLYDSRAALPIALGVGGPGAERARLDAARAGLAEFELRKRAGELVEVADLKATWSDRVLTWRERIRAVPSEAVVHVAGFTPSMGRDLLRLIDQTLTEIADGGVPRTSRRRARAK